MSGIFPIESIWITEDRGCFFERDTVFFWKFEMAFRMSHENTLLYIQ